MTKKVGIIGLGEAGNLGDDLILIATVAAVMAAVPDAEVRHLSSDTKIDWGGLPEPIRPTGRVERVIKEQELPGSRWPQRVFQDVDALIFGGGGLLQDVHHPYRPYHWLRFLPTGSRSVPCLAVGLGMGPLQDRWLRWLSRHPMPFDACYLRDEGSVALARPLGWNVGLCHDFVDEAFLSHLGVTDSCNSPASRRLGVSLRAWPGLSTEAAVRIIEDVARREATSEIAFFVLEDRGGGIDETFTREVMARITNGAQLSISTYRASALPSFLRDMSYCVAAVSMKLHASAIWHQTGATLYPIVYAPKVAAMFGRPYQGLELLTEPATVPAYAVGVPRASEIVRSWLQNTPHSATNPTWRLSPVQRFEFQARAFVVDAYKKGVALAAARGKRKV